MPTVQAFFKRHPLLSFYALAFAITWGGVYLISGGPAGFPNTKDEFAGKLPSFIPVLLGGPSVAGALLIASVYGRAGFRELLSRLFKWRVAARWYAMALVVAPLVLFAELLALSLFSPVFLPGIFLAGDKVSALVSAIVAGLIVGFFEEFGWTGFATPRLRLRYGVLVTGLIMGVLWGAWHIFLNVIYVSKAYSGDLPPALFIAARGFGDLVGLLPAYRVLMVWIYDRTGSLLVVMLMHASLTASTMITDSPALVGTSMLVYDAVSTVVMWVVVALVLVAIRGWHAERGPDEAVHPDAVAARPVA
jgi:uncharacterized protein